MILKNWNKQSNFSVKGNVVRREQPFIYGTISVRFSNNAGKSGSSFLKCTPAPRRKLLRGNFTQSKVHFPPSNFLQTVPSSLRIPPSCKMVAYDSARKILSIEYDFNL